MVKNYYCHTTLKKTTKRSNEIYLLSIICINTSLSTLSATKSSPSFPVSKLFPSISFYYLPLDRQEPFNDDQAFSANQAASSVFQCIHWHLSFTCFTKTLPSTNTSSRRQTRLKRNLHRQKRTHPQSTKSPALH